MKFGIKLSNITIGDVNVGGLELNSEFSINEMVAIRKETEYVLKKLPEYLVDIANAVNTCEAIDEAMTEELEVKAFERSVIEQIKKSILKDINAVG